MKNLTKVRIGGVPEHFNLPIHLAVERGDFEKNGIEINWTDFPGGTGAMCAALRKDEVDIVMMLTEGTVLDLIEGNPSRILQFYVSSPLIWGIFVSAKSKIESLKDLENKKYAISRFRSGSHIMALVNAKSLRQEITQEDFVIVNNLEGARKALAEGSADIFMWEKYTTMPYVTNGEFRIVGECVTPWSCFVMTASDKFIQTKAEIIPILLDVINKSCAKLILDPNAVEEISKRYGLKKDEAEAWFRNLEYQKRPILSEDELQVILFQLKKLDIIKEIPDIERLVYQATFESTGYEGGIKE